MQSPTQTSCSPMGCTHRLRTSFSRPCAVSLARSRSRRSCSRCTTPPVTPQSSPLLPASTGRRCAKHATTLASRRRNGPPTLSLRRHLHRHRQRIGPEQCFRMRTTARLPMIAPAPDLDQDEPLRGNRYRMSCPRYGRRSLSRRRSPPNRQRHRCRRSGRRSPGRLRLAHWTRLSSSPVRVETTPVEDGAPTWRAPTLDGDHAELRHSASCRGPGLTMGSSRRWMSPC
jgi:hypothetical protein